MTSTTDPQGTHRQAGLRVYLLVQNLQPQFAAYLGSPTRARGYPPEVLSAVAGRDHVADRDHAAGREP